MRRAIPRTVTVLLITLVAVHAVWGQTAIDGTWTGVALSPQAGSVDVKMVLKADGQKVTGHWLTADGDEVPVEEGLLEGNKLTCRLTTPDGARVRVDGVVGDGEITVKGVLEGTGVTYDVVLKRTAGAAKP